MTAARRRVVVLVALSLAVGALGTVPAAATTDTTVAAVSDVAPAVGSDVAPAGASSAVPIVTCSEYDGVVRDARVESSLVVDGPCTVERTVVTGDVVVSAQGRLFGHDATFERDLVVSGYVSTGAEILGDVRLAAPMAELYVEGATVRGDLRGDARELGVYGARVDGALDITLHGGYLILAGLQVQGAATTRGGEVHVDGGHFAQGLTMVAPRGFPATSTERSVWMCDVVVDGDLTLVDLRNPLRREPWFDYDPCGGRDGPSIVGGTLTIRDSAPVSLFPPAQTVTFFRVAGDLVCTGNVGGIAVAPDVTVGGERRGQCAGTAGASSSAGVAPGEVPSLRADGALASDGAPPIDGTLPSDGALPADGALPSDDALPSDGAVAADPAPAAATRCSDLGGEVAHRRVVGDLLVDVECRLHRAAVTGDAVVARGGRLWATWSTVKGDVRAQGRVVLQRSSVYGGVRLSGSAFSADDVTVRRSVRGTGPVVDLAHTRVEGNVNVTGQLYVAFTDSEVIGPVRAVGPLWVTGSTFRQDVTSDYAGSSYPVPGHPDVWLCGATVEGDLTFTRLHGSLRRADPTPGDPCGGAEARSTVEGSLAVLDPEPWTEGDTTITVRHLDVAGDVECRADPGVVVIGADVTVGGQRLGECG